MKGRLQLHSLSSRLEGPFGSSNLLGAILVSFGANDSWPDWLATHIPSAKRADFLAEVAQVVVRHTRTWITELTQSNSTSSDSAENSYRRRTERCLWHHWERFADGAERLSTAEQVLARLEGGDLGYERPQTNVVREVLLAQALEQHEARAAKRFEEEFMPIIRSIAQRTAGDRGLEMVENFVADLVLPRETRPPRISGYLGKTSLASWLRVVVTNHCREAGRHPEPVQQMQEFDPPNPSEDNSQADAGGCEGLLQPIFTQAVSALENEDRLLIKLLILDDVPQQTLAQRMGIHSGNVTRRRQRISQTIWARVREMGTCSSAPGRVTDCLELVLTGNQIELQRALGDALARAVTSTEEA